MFCLSVADNVENPTQSETQAGVVCANAASTAIPPALFAAGTGLYYVSYTITASGITQGAVGRVTVNAAGAVTDSSGFGSGYIQSAGAATYLQLTAAAGGAPAIQNATAAPVTVSLIVTKIAA
jgi:hypothetical protein